jgi:nucleoside-diphosphate-sugar epimerase
MPEALVIGGTGPTGPKVVAGLVARGFRTTILHGGQHEVEFAVPGIEHIHEDPHFEETLRRGLGDRTFDLVVAQYGRLRIVADVLAGRTERLVAVGGATGIYGGEADLRWGGMGRPALFPDSTEIFASESTSAPVDKIGVRMVQAMDRLFDHHARGSYSASYVTYPVNYGPRNPGPYDWSIIRRALDGRRRVVIADGGMRLESRVYSPNAANAVLLVIDNPDIAAGKRYSVADRYTFTMRQRIEFIGAHLGREFELVDMPYDVAWAAHPYWRRMRDHKLCESTIIRQELGYHEEVEPDAALAATIDWLVANPPEPGGEAERQVGDPFDYVREDELIERWLGLRATLGNVDNPLPDAGHQYRHPKAPGEAWRPAARPR